MLMLALIVAGSIAFTGCKKKEDPTSSSTGGSSSNPGIGQGTLELSIVHDQKQCTSAPGVIHTVGIGYSSTDMANNSFFITKTGSNSKTHTFSLDEGLYYYKGIACCNGCNDNICKSDLGLGNEDYCGNRAGASKSGSVTIIADKTINKTINLK